MVRRLLRLRSRAKRRATHCWRPAARPAVGRAAGDGRGATFLATTAPASTPEVSDDVEGARRADRDRAAPDTTSRCLTRTNARLPSVPTASRGTTSAPGRRDSVTSSEAVRSGMRLGCEPLTSMSAMNTRAFGDNVETHPERRDLGDPAVERQLRIGIEADPDGLAHFELVDVGLVDPARARASSSG